VTAFRRDERHPEASDCVSMTSIVSPYISRSYYLSLRCVNDPTQIREKEAALHLHKVHSLK